MTIRRVLAALTLTAALASTPSPAEAAACTIPNGTYLRVTSWGCGAVGWIATGNGLGEWIGNVEALGNATVSIQRQAPNGTWVTVGSDQSGNGVTGISAPGRPPGAARLRNLATGSTRTLPVYQG